MWNAQVCTALVERSDVCIYHAGETYTWLHDGELSHSFPLHSISLTVLVDVDPLMRLSLTTCLTGTQQSPPFTVLLSRRFNHENVMLLPVTFQLVRLCWPFVAPNHYLTCCNLYHLSTPFQLSNLYCHSNLCCLPCFPFAFHLLHTRTWPNDRLCIVQRPWNFHFCPFLSFLKTAQLTI